MLFRTPVLTIEQVDILLQMHNLQMNIAFQTVFRPLVEAGNVQVMDLVREALRVHRNFNPIGNCLLNWKGQFQQLNRDKSDVYMTPPVHAALTALVSTDYTAGKDLTDVQVLALLENITKAQPALREALEGAPAIDPQVLSTNQPPGGMIPARIN